MGARFCALRVGLESWRCALRVDPGGGCLIGGYPKSAAAAGVSPHRTAPDLPRTQPGPIEEGHPKAAFV